MGAPCSKMVDRDVEPPKVRAWSGCGWIAEAWGTCASLIA